MDQTDDIELFLKLREGDEQAFQTIFRNYYQALCNYAYQHLNNRDLAEEAVQDIFVKIWEKRSSINIETSVKNYFFRSVRNQCLNILQHEKIKKQYAGKVLETSVQEIDPGHFYLEVNLIQRIEKSIESLPPKRREIFRLSREQGLKYKEIADTLNISVKTVEAQMGLALKHLRSELREFSNYLLTLFYLIKKNLRTTIGVKQDL